MVVRIPIHLLHNQAYCEYQIFLERVKGIEIEPTKEMEEGKEIHSLLEEDHKKRSSLHLHVSEAIKQSIEDNVTLVGREILVSGKLLYGRIDEAHLMPNQIIIIDDKPDSYPYFSNKKQVWGYCLAFIEHYNTELPIIATLRQRDTQEIYWQKEFTVEDQNMVVESTIRILDILNGQREPEPTSRSTKCRSCRLRNECDKCLASD